MRCCFCRWSIILNVSRAFWKTVNNNAIYFCKKYLVYYLNNIFKPTVVAFRLTLNSNFSHFQHLTFPCHFSSPPQICFILWQRQKWLPSFFPTLSHHLSIHFKLSPNNTTHTMEHYQIPGYMIKSAQNRIEKE